MIRELVQHETHPKSLFRSVKLMIRASANVQSSADTANLHLWPRVRELLAGHGPLRVCAAQILARLFVEAADTLSANPASTNEHANEICEKWVQVLDECTQSTMVIYLFLYLSIFIFICFLFINDIIHKCLRLIFNVGS